MRAGCAGGGKGALIGDKMSNTLATGNDQAVVVTPNGQDLADTIDASYYKGNGARSGKERPVVYVSFGIGNGQAAEACDMQEELSQTLHCMHDGQAVMCAPVAAGFMGGQGEKAGSLGFREEVAPTLKGAPSGSNQVPDVPVTDKQCVSTRNLSSALTGTEACPAHAKVVCYENNPTDARQKETDVSPSVLARWGTGGNQTPLVQPMQGFVRRLTTVECARLQGFPDHHTEIPWKRKRIVSFENGKKTIKYVQLPTSNGPQYKAYGNSMCVNVMEWLGNKIQGEIYANSTPKMAR